MNNPYKFRNTIKPVRNTDHYINSESMYLYHNGSFVLMDALLGGYTTLAVSGRELVPQSVSTTPYANGYDGSLVKYSNHASRTIKVVYAVDLIGTSAPAFFSKLNYFLSNGKIKFQFNDDRDWYYNGYVTAIGELSGKGDVRTGDFTITCYDPFKHHITDGHTALGQYADSAGSEGYSNVHGVSVLINDSFDAPSPISIIGISGVVPNETLTVTLNNARQLTHDEETHMIVWTPSDQSTDKEITIDVPQDVTDLAIYLPTEYQTFAVYSGSWTWTQDGQFEIQTRNDITPYVDTQSDVDNWCFFGENNGIIADSKSLNKSSAKLLTVYDEEAL